MSWSTNTMTLAMPTKEYQEHEGVKDGNTLYVQYNYDTTASSGASTPRACVPRRSAIPTPAWCT